MSIFSRFPILSRHHGETIELTKNIHTTTASTSLLPQTRGNTHTRIIMSSLVDSIFGSKKNSSSKSNAEERGDGGAAVSSALLSELFETPLVLTESTARTDVGSAPTTRSPQASSSQVIIDDPQNNIREKRGRNKKRKTVVVPETTTTEPQRTSQQDDDDQVPPEETTGEDLGSSSGPPPPLGVEDVDTRTVFVGNLPLGTSRKQLHQHFAQACTDPIESTRIRGVPVQGIKIAPDRAGNQNLVKKVCVNANLVDTTKTSSCVGYVVFHSIQGVEQALKLNNTSFPSVPTVSGGVSSSLLSRHIRVDRVTPTHDAARSVFVGNLPYRTDEETFRQHVCHHCDISESDVEGVRVVRDTDFQCRGFAYILLAHKSLVPTALRTLPGTKYLGRELRVQVCGKRFKNHRGETPARKRPKHKHPSSLGGEAGIGADTAAAAANPTGALRRIMGAEKTKKRRPRGPDKHKGTTAHKSSGMSKRAAAEAKAGKRVKKIQKRISKGMGKAKTK